jgi:Tfp pilus assembly protein PilO
MKQTYLSNLRPSEKRLLVGVLVVLFIVLNFWFVFPRFSDWGTNQARLWEAQEKLTAYRKEEALLPSYQKLLREFERGGENVPAEEQSSQFLRIIQNQIAQSGVTVQGSTKQSSRTNQYLLELSQNYTVEGPEQQLVDFLYSLSAGNSLIRVRDLNVRPNPPRQQLSANVKLVASFQKKTPPKPGTLPGPGGKPASSSQTASSTAKRP